MSLPTVIIFEQHFDVGSTRLLQRLMPRLLSEGYNTLCFEASHNMRFDQILAGMNENIAFCSGLLAQAQDLLKKRRIKVQGKLSDMSYGKLIELMWRAVSSTKYAEVAEKIKHLPALTLFRDILRDADKQSVMIEGVDLDHKSRQKMMKDHPSERRAQIDKLEGTRIQCFANHLLKLRKEREGLLFVCGASHAPGLIAELKKRGVQESDLVYGYVHAGKRFDDSIDEVKMYGSNPTLKDRTYVVSSDSAIQSLAGKLVMEIKSKNQRYMKCLEKHGRAILLKQVFKANFQCYLRPGYYVDALLKDLSNSKQIIETLDKFKIPHRMGDKCLIIPEVNTKEVAEKLERLRP